jgi:hypothetical protein
MKQKIMVPAVSVGLLVTGREAAANVIDFGLVAESLTVGATFTAALNTIGGYTLGGLTFVGSHLSDVIGGNTVGNILNTILGNQGLTLTFGFSGNGGASGNFTILPPAALALVNNSVTLTENTIGGMLTACTPNVPGTVTGCAPGNQAQLTPYDPTGLLKSLEAVGIVTVSSPPFSNGLLGEIDKTLTITLGTFDGTTYQGEEIVTTDSISATSAPEPAGWSLAALGSAMLAWWRRRR